MFARLPPAVTRLICLFVLATPLLQTALAIPAQAPPVAATVANADAPTRIQPRAGSQPSKRMGQRRSKKTEPLKKKDYSSFLCPGGSVACPIPSQDITPASAAVLESNLDSLAAWFKVGFECVELDTELNQCGGCLALGAG